MVNPLTCVLFPMLFGYALMITVFLIDRIRFIWKIVIVVATILILAPIYAAILCA